MGKQQRSAAGPCEPGEEPSPMAFGLVGRSPSFLAAFDLARRFAGCGAPVLVRGQTGNGKELFARAIHYMSPRKGRPFVPVNCGALPDALVESELFGHARGAFTDARAERAGLVATARGGTLFLDEVDSLSPKAQVALLRFLQDLEFRKVGGDAVERADVRIVAATNVDLAEETARGRFRQDLLFRLDVLAIALPSLAERRDDVPRLARHFLMRFAGLYGGDCPRLEPEVEAWLVEQDWPGNVRQLENLMHRAFVLAAGGSVRLAAVAPEIAPNGSAGAGRWASGAAPSGGLKALRQREMRAFERAYLNALMSETRGNVSEAARRAGAERRALGRMLKRNGIDSEAFRG